MSIVGLGYSPEIVSTKDRPFGVETWYSLQWMKVVNDHGDRCKSSKDPFVPLPNGRTSWLINGGDPKHLYLLGWYSKLAWWLSSRVASLGEIETLREACPWTRENGGGPMFFVGEFGSERCFKRITTAKRKVWLNVYLGVVPPLPVIGIPLSKKYYNDSPSGLP